MISRCCDVLARLTCCPVPTRDPPKHGEYWANLPGDRGKTVVDSAPWISYRRTSFATCRARLLGASGLASRTGLGVLRSNARYATHLAVFKIGNEDLHRRRLRSGRHLGVRQRVPGVAAIIDGETPGSCRPDPHTRTRTEFESVQRCSDCRLRGLATMAPTRCIRCKRVEAIGMPGLCESTSNE